MATKSTSKTTAKKPTAKKPAAAKPRAKKNASVAHKKPVVATRTTRHLRLTKDDESFMQIRVNRETVYWVILGVVVVSFSIWIMNLQADIQRIYDQIEIDSATQSSMVMPKKV